MVTRISPWSVSVHLTSPDGKLAAIIDNAGEIAMGGPSVGVLKISNGLLYYSCNPSIVWSDDSKYLAVPQWTQLRNQRLMIISMEELSARYVPGEFRVLYLQSFSDGKINGINSHEEIEINTTEIQLLDA